MTTRDPLPTDTLIRSSYGDPLLRRKGLNPYQRRPERSTWEESEVYASIDGSTWERRRNCSRWGGEYSYGPWRIV